MASRAQAFTFCRTDKTPAFGGYSTTVVSSASIARRFLQDQLGNCLSWLTVQTLKAMSPTKHKFIHSRGDSWCYSYNSASSRLYSREWQANDTRDFTSHWHHTSTQWQEVLYLWDQMSPADESSPNASPMKRCHRSQRGFLRTYR